MNIFSLLVPYEYTLTSLFCATILCNDPSIEAEHLEIKNGVGNNTAILPVGHIKNHGL
jgi:hypothetical protein